MLWSEINTIVSDLTDADTTAFPTATRLIYANQAQSELAGDIIDVDERWQWDDTNYTDLPIGTANLVAGQQDYSIDDTFLQIERVEVLDANNDYQLLTPIDKRSITVALTEYKSTDGLPEEYDKQGRSLFLYPAPASGSVTLTNGLKVYFKRTTKDITTFGATSPGFASPFHIVLAYKIAIPYCMKYKKDRVDIYRDEAQKLRNALLDFYGQREKDEVIRVTPARHDNK